MNSVSFPLTLPWRTEHLLLVRATEAIRLCRAGRYESLSYQESAEYLDGLSRYQMGALREFFERALRRPVTGLDDFAVRAVLRESLKHRDLIVLREPRGGAGGNDSNSAHCRRLASDIERLARGRLFHEGRRYRLVADVDLADLPGRDRYEVVRHDDAVRILEGQAGQGSVAGTELAKRLAEAGKRLTRDWRPPLQPDGLILLRQVAMPAAVANTDAPITPSQLLQIVREHEDAKKVDFVLELRTEDGYPIPEAAYEATLADGEVRTGALERDGTALLEGVAPGPVLVRYPDDDDVSAKAWAVYARRALDKQDFFPVWRLLQRSPTSLRSAIQAYDKYFNDYTGGGFLQDLDTVFTDPDAHATVATLLASADIAFGKPFELIRWDEQEGV